MTEPGSQFANVDHRSAEELYLKLKRQGKFKGQPFGPMHMYTRIGLAGYDLPLVKAQE